LCAYLAYKSYELVLSNLKNVPIQTYEHQNEESGRIGLIRPVLVGDMTNNQNTTQAQKNSTNEKSDARLQSHQHKNEEYGGISLIGSVMAGDMTSDQNTTRPQKNSTNEKNSLGLMNSSSSFTLDALKVNSTFEWKDLDVTRVGVPSCGCVKCFFRHASDESVGYTLQTWGKDIGISECFKVATKAWIYAKHLERTYGARHFMLEPPFTKRTGRKALQWLDSNWTDSTSRSRHQNQMYQGIKVILQKNRMAPQQSIIFKSNGNSDKLTKPRMDILWRSTKDQREFANRLLLEWNRVLTMLKGEKNLFYDFQIMIDNRGRIYHFDLDRVYYEPFKRGAIEKFQDDFDWLIRDYHHNLTMQL